MLAASLAFAGAASAQFKSDWEAEQELRNWREIEVPLPAHPKPENLVEFVPSNTTSFRFFIDAASLGVGRDGVVRYTLVARSPSGVDNVSFEGIRCVGGLVRVYATGRSDGTWTPRADSRWREIEPKTIQRWHQALRREYFCPQDAIILDAAEGIDALRRGGHPNKGHTSSD